MHSTHSKGLRGLLPPEGKLTPQWGANLTRQLSGAREKHQNKAKKQHPGTVWVWFTLKTEGRIDGTVKGAVMTLKCPREQ